MSNLPRCSPKPVLRPFAVPGKDLATDAAYIDAAIQLDPSISARWVFDAIMHHAAELPSQQEFEAMQERVGELEYEIQDAPIDDDLIDERHDVQDKVASRLRSILLDCGDDRLRHAVEDLAAELESHDF